MTFKSKILGIVGGVLFLAFVAVNLTVSQSYQGDESMAQLTLVELAAKAQSGDEAFCPLDIDHCLPTGCYVASWANFAGPGDPAIYYWQYNGCQSICSEGGRNCCYLLYGGC